MQTFCVSKGLWVHEHFAEGKQQMLQVGLSIVGGGKSVFAYLDMT